MDRFEIRLLRPADTGSVAQVHAACFDGYFLSQLGRPFLRRYYAEFCRHEFDHGVVGIERETGRLAAFVVGTSDTQAHFRGFYRRHMLVLAPLVLMRFCTNGIVRRTLFQRMAHIQAALGALLPGTQRDATRTISSKGPKNQCPVRLLSIAAAPDFRGSGVAGLVTAAFEQALREAGHRRVGLSVHADNERAIAFYKKINWQVTYASDGGWWFEKDL